MVEVLFMSLCSGGKTSYDEGDNNFKEISTETPARVLYILQIVQSSCDETSYILSIIRV